MPTPEIELVVGEWPARPGVELARCESKLATLHALEAALAAATASEPAEIVLAPPVPDALSIPFAFKMLVGLLEDMDAPPRVRVHVESAAMLDQLARYLPRDEASVTRFACGRFALEFVTADLLAVRADAIVNASNAALHLGGGVSGAIAAAADPALQDALTVLAHRRSLAPGDVVVTGAYGLPHARAIVHAVAIPGGVDVIAAAVRGALACADAEAFASLALPALGTGTGGHPVEDFVDGLRGGVRRRLAEAAAGSLERVIVAAWTASDHARMVARWRDAEVPGGA